MKHNKTNQLIQFLLFCFSILLLIGVIYFSIFLIGVPYSNSDIKMVKYDGKYFYKNIGYNIIDYLLHPVDTQNIWIKINDDNFYLDCKKINVPILNLAGVCLWRKKNKLKDNFKMVYDNTGNDCYGILKVKSNKIIFQIQK